jgi:predicted small lipoprotein YifL
MRRAAWMLAGAVAPLLAGCGQKGALYLPDKNAQVVTTPAASPLPAQSAPAPATPATPAPPKPTDKNEDPQAPK